MNIPKQLNIINQVQTYEYSVGESITEQTFSLKSMKYPITELLFVLRRNDSSTHTMIILTIVKLIKQI